MPKLQPTVDYPADERARSIVINCGTMPAMPISAASIEMVAISVVMWQVGRSTALCLPGPVIGQGLKTPQSIVNRR